jgi:hypothetical protein
MSVSNNIMRRARVDNVGMTIISKEYWWDLRELREERNKTHVSCRPRAYRSNPTIVHSPFAV